MLINLKKHPKPAQVVSTPFTVAYDPESCKKCGICVKRCQMDAVTMVEERVELQQDRCIGCGLCISTCPTGSLKLVRKPEDSLNPVPENVLESNLLTARARGKMGRVSMAKMSIRSKWDRMLAK